MATQDPHDPFDDSFTGPRAWDAGTAFTDGGVIRVDTRCMQEIRALAADLRARPEPVAALDIDDFELPACRALGAQVRRVLDQGIGFAILDRLPVDEIGADVATRIYWLLMSTISRPVAQKWDGTMVYDVVDTGRKPAAGNGVRSSKSNVGQRYHTDNSFNLPPECVALLCLRPAMSGGESGLISFETVHNRLRESHPEVIPRLRRWFWFDRQREHAPDDALTARHPVFEYPGGALRVRLASGLIRQGYQLHGESIDEEGATALRALNEVLEQPGLGKQFVFEPGQIQIVNNRSIGHRRTAFKDFNEPGRQRHLVRMWLRDGGGNPAYLG